MALTPRNAPRVFFEIESAKGFEQVYQSDGRPLTDAGIETVVFYQPKPNYLFRAFPAGREHQWSIDWELTADVPQGRYRIRVEGQNWDGTQVQPYTVLSQAFDIIPSTNIAVQNLAIDELGGNSYTISCNGYWPPNPEGYRVRHLETDPNAPSLISGGQALATVTLAGDGIETVTLLPVSEGYFEGTFTPPGTPLNVRIEAGDLEDGFENINGAIAGPVNFP